MTTPTQATYTGEFRLLMFHSYGFAYEPVADGYVPAPGEVVVVSAAGPKARRVNDPSLNITVIGWHPDSIQNIHNDRHEARLSIAEHMATCTDPNCAADETTPGHLPLPYRNDLGIILKHVEDAVLPFTTDTTALLGFQCDEHPEVAQFLNLAYGLTFVPERPVAEIIYGTPVEQIEASLAEGDG